MPILCVDFCTHCPKSMLGKTDSLGNSVDSGAFREIETRKNSLREREDSDPGYVDFAVPMGHLRGVCVKTFMDE